MKVYELLIEDLTTLGHMGSSSTVKERRMFIEPNQCKIYAEINYGKDIKWTKLSSGSWTSGDLRHVMYSIRARTVE